MHRPLSLALALAYAVAVVACGSSDETRPSNGVVLTGGGTTTTSTTSSSGGAGGAGGTSSTSTGGGGAGGASSCSPECASNRLCCDGVCIDNDNDLQNCGKCGRVCADGPHPYCDLGTCEQAPCSVFLTCGSAEFCCGTTCCAASSLCCTVDPVKGPECLATDACPPGN